MGKLAESRERRPALIVAGIAAGIVTILLPIPSTVTLLPVPWEGVWLGLAIGLYFLATGPVRSVLKTVSNGIVSAAAYWLAFEVTVWTHMFMRVGGPDEPGLIPLLAGGAVGALAVSTTTFFLFANADDEAMSSKVIVCTAAGALLAVAGFQLGTSRHATGRPIDEAMPALFLVWQSGLALTMGLVWPAPASNEAP